MARISFMNLCKKGAKIVAILLCIYLPKFFYYEMVSRPQSLLSA